MADEQLPEGTDTIVNGASGHSDDASSAGASFSEAPKSGATAGASDDKGAWFGKIDELKAQGFDSARAYAVTGKDRATSALDELIRTVSDAASQIDSKVGSQYGDYARRAADGLGSLSDGLKNKDVDELFAEARAIVAKAPAVAVGTAAALGFVIARLARSGLPETAAEPAKAED